MFGSSKSTVVNVLENGLVSLGPPTSTAPCVLVMCAPGFSMFSEKAAAAASLLPLLRILASRQAILFSNFSVKTKDPQLWWKFEVTYLSSKVLVDASLIYVQTQRQCFTEHAGGETTLRRPSTTWHHRAKQKTPTSPPAKPRSELCGRYPLYL